MNIHTAKQLKAFLRAAADAPERLLLLDYDGTLADFRVDRFKAKPWAGVNELLKQIQRRRRTRIVAITGRPPEEVAAMLHLHEPIEVWGLHGALRLNTNGSRELEKQSPEVKNALSALRNQLHRDALGGLFEDKPNAAVMHWRGHAPAKAKEIEKRTRALFEPLARIEGLRLLKFESGLELRTGRDKGGAIEQIIREGKRGAAVTYLGDDWTDEPGFEAVNAAKGPHLSVLVKREKRETVADVWLKPPHELREFLRLWLEME
ncbi:MAG: trehalose-phosphatase [Acidobacteriota bacterium]|nr:trehalose-phosphatase [Acidobacteriota bacterium]